MRGLVNKLVSRSLSVSGKWQQQQLRRLNIHEYQGAELMGKYGVDLIIACKKGGTNIEDLAENFPDMIIKVPIDVFAGITDEDAAKVVDGLAPKVADRKDSIEQVKKLYELFRKSDCTMLEINPLAETSTNHLVAADAKLNFDDNAAFRQKEVFALRDPTQEDPREGISEELKTLCSGDFKSAKITSYDTQESRSGGFLLVVTGYFTLNERFRNKFTQTFFLAPQENGYFVLNDILRFVNEPHATAAKSASGKESQTHTPINAPTGNQGSEEVACVSVKEESENAGSSSGT